VFGVDKYGNLSVYWVSGGGAWNGPHYLSVDGRFPPGAHVAASQQFGLTQTDVFAVDWNGNLAVYWVGPNTNWNWTGPYYITTDGRFPPGAPIAVSPQTVGWFPTQTDVFVIDWSGGR
jgi:hypothetical protein